MQNTAAEHSTYRNSRLNRVGAQPQFQRRYGNPPPPRPPLPLVTLTGVLPALLVPVRGKSLTDCYEMGALGSGFGSMGAFFALIWPIAALSFVVKTWCLSG